MLRSIAHLVMLVCLLIPVGAVAVPAHSAGAAQPQIMPPHPRLKEAIERGEVVPPHAMVESASSPTPGQRLGFDQPRNGPRRFTDPLKGVTASLNALAVVVDFSDNVKTVTATYFDTLIFAAPVAGRGSVRDYYSEVSYGTIDIVTVNLPSSMGWKRAPQTYAYYVNANYCTDGIYPHNCQKLAEDIVDAVNGVVDFSNYDNNGDGYAEPIMLIHAGPGAELTGNNTDIWSHSWSLNTARNYDGVTIADYVIMPEYWTTVSAATSDMTIGVFVHEMGHGFWGLPDVYDRDYSSEGVGRWSLMAGGSWNGPNSGGWGSDGSSPAWPDAWCRTQMGFVPATSIVGNVTGRSIPRAYGNPPSAQTVLKLRSAVLGAQEYFLLENRQQVVNSYDEYLPGNGLLVWHVDEAMNTYSLQNDYECTLVPHCQCSDSQHFLLALEQADGLRDLEFGNDSGDTGDPFPGNATNRTWTMLTNPESSSWYGSRCAVGAPPAGGSEAVSQTKSGNAPVAQAPRPQGETPDTPTVHSSPTGSPVKPELSANPKAVLWDQPLSTVNQAAYVDQEFPDFTTYSSYLADDFSNGSAWTINTIFVPGDGWNGFSSLFNATALHWMIYADCAGVPCGDPSGGGSSPVWSLALPPTDPQVSITNGTPGGLPSNTTLNLTTPINLPAGHWWFIFYPTMSYGTYGQHGRQPADTANGYIGQFINPGGGFGYGTAWQVWSVLGPTQQDIAFRLEGSGSGSGCADTCIGVTNISNSGATMTADLQVSCGPGPDNWVYLPLVFKSFATGGVLWDQPLSAIDQNAYVDQQFPDYPTYSSYLADDFSNGSVWGIGTIFVPGRGWNGFTTLFNASSLTWQIYGDCGGVPCGDPSGGGSPPVWTLTLAPTDAQVTITNGSDGYPSNTLLELATPVNLPAGHWWLVFYPVGGFGSFGQYGRQPADTANGYIGQFINPGGGFGYGMTWQNWTVVGPILQDIAFRLEGK
jgi:immune inhibitor A